VSQVQCAWDMQRAGVEVAQKKWKGPDRFAVVSRMGRGMAEAHIVTTGIRVAGSISTDNKGVVTSVGEAEEERGASACGMKGMDPHSDIYPDHVIDEGPAMRSGHEPPDG